MGNGSTIDCSSLFPRVFSVELKVASDSSSDLPKLASLSATQGAQDMGTQKLRYLLVLDLAGKYEITNFPVIAIDAVAGCELGRFHHYVRPVHRVDGCALNDSSPAIAFTTVLK